MMPKFHLARLVRRLLPRMPDRASQERAYLDASVSLYDLECRERDIDRGKFAGF